MDDFKHFNLGLSESDGQQFFNSMPIRLERGGLFLCRAGHSDITIDFKRYHIQKGDMVVAFPFSILQVIHRSDDFDGDILSADIHFFSSIQINDKSKYYLVIKDHPCISLGEHEWERIVLLHQRLIRERLSPDHPLHQEINACMIKIITYEIAAMYIQRKPIEQMPRTCQEKIFEKFIDLLFRHFQTRRDLSFYAAKQSITPRHLSTIVKRMSGMTAGHWIVFGTIANIKLKLQNPQLSVMDIAYEMNFPNPSFFSQYFKKHTGLTPNEYRKSIQF